MPSLARYAWLSVATALATMALKGLAAWLTGSLGLLSDALESFVNLGAALVALYTLGVAARQPDEKHPFGYTKAEYFSAAVEGGLILLAALAIVVTAVPRLVDPQPIERFDVGIFIALLAAALNLGTALVLLRAGKRHDSIALEADAHHLLTDVWTSIGVVVGVGATVLTGWLALDPLIAIAVAVHIAWTGARVLRRATLGLMDRALGRISEPDTPNGPSNSGATCAGCSTVGRAGARSGSRSAAAIRSRPSSSRRADSAGAPVAGSARPPQCEASQ
jgi:cation diffusion facilitator family transporter